MNHHDTDTIEARTNDPILAAIQDYLTTQNVNTTITPHNPYQTTNILEIEDPDTSTDITHINNQIHIAHYPHHPDDILPGCYKHQIPISDPELLTKILKIIRPWL